jgi:hypothetical protein
MVTVPSNVVLGNLIIPAGNPITADPAQFTGETINFQAGTCPQPFGSLAGIEYCTAWCLNSCPELIPDQSKRTTTGISQLQTVAGFVQLAIDSANATLSAQLLPVQVSGIAIFPIPPSTSLAVIQASIAVIKSSLAASSPFPVSFDV